MSLRLEGTEIIASIELVGNYLKVYVASPERTGGDTHLPCLPENLLGEDEVFHPILVEGINC